MLIVQTKAEMFCRAGEITFIFYHKIFVFPKAFYVVFNLNCVFKKLAKIELKESRQ